MKNKLINLQITKDQNLAFISMLTIQKFPAEKWTSSQEEGLVMFPAEKRTSSQGEGLVMFPTEKCTSSQGGGLVMFVLQNLFKGQKVFGPF